MQQPIATTGSKQRQHYRDVQLPAICADYNVLSVNLEDYIWGDPLTQAGPETEWECPTEKINFFVVVFLLQQPCQYLCWNVVGQHLRSTFLTSCQLTLSSNSSSVTVCKWAKILLVLALVDVVKAQPSKPHGGADPCGEPKCCQGLCGHFGRSGLHQNPASFTDAPSNWGTKLITIKGILVQIILVRVTDNIFLRTTKCLDIFLQWKVCYDICSGVFEYFFVPSTCSFSFCSLSCSREIWYCDHHWPSPALH